MTRLHRVWLVLLFATQLAFIAVMPAGLGNDENGHLLRMWALADGHFFCKTVPKAARELERLNLRPFFHQPQSFRLQLRQGLTLEGADRVDGDNYECIYFPLGVALPALAARWVAMDASGTPRSGGVFVASYAARVVEIAVVDAALLFFLLTIPWARSTVLAFFSIPMVIEQSLSVGHDGAIFALCLLLLSIVLRRDDTRALILVAAIVSLMTVTKPVYAFFGLLALPNCARRKLRPHQWIGLVLAPLVSYVAWLRAIRSFDHARVYWRPQFARPADQLRYLLHHPFHLARVLFGYFHYFFDDGKLPDFEPHRIQGVWTTFLFANLWFEISRWAYLFAIVGLCASLFADITSTERAIDLPAPRWSRIAAWAGVLVVVPGTIFVMYLMFSPVGAASANGCQGRYFAVAWLAAWVLALHWWKRKSARAWPGSTATTLTALTAMISADALALQGIWKFYWTR